jgi:ABC-type branched-subunit amino acid transport system ATPase component
LVQLKLYGAVVSVFSSVEPLKNSTLVRVLPLPAVALADSVTVAGEVKVAPAAGPVRLTVGAAAETVTDTVALAALKLASVALVAVTVQLATRPRLLLLDEPASGLNPEETRDLAFWIDDIRSDMGVTVIMVEHDMSLVAEVADRVLCMNLGEVLSTGTAAEVQSDPRVIAAYLGG